MNGMATFKYSSMLSSRCSYILFNIEILKHDKISCFDNTWDTY